MGSTGGAMARIERAAMDDDQLPGICLSELLRLGHAYLSIEDPQRRLEALRIVEAIAGSGSSGPGVKQ